MSIFLEFPSIEDYPVYNISGEKATAGRLLPAVAFSWLLTLEFSALKSPELVSFDPALAGPDQDFLGTKGNRI